MQTYQRTLAVREGLLAPTIAVAIPLAALLATVLAACASIPDSERQTNPVGVTAANQMSSLKEAVINAINQRYFQEPEIDTSFPAQDIVRRLDPFSHYFPRDEYDRFMSDMRDEEYHYGFDFRACAGKIIVTVVTPESPAAEAGLLPGDEIESVSKKLTYGQAERFDQLLKQSSKNCEFGIRRANEKKPIRVWMERATTTESSVPIAMMLDSATGYIKIEGFHRGTSNRLLTALQQLSKRGAKAVVLDVRDNGGGFVDEALQAVNLFIHSDSPVLELRSRFREENKTYALREPAPYATMPLALLVDNGSASATEIFGGILQDRSRATVIGQPTTGKGLVMRMFNLPNNDRVFLTTSEYILPSGRCVQRPYLHDTMYANYAALESQENFDHKLDSQIATSDCSAYPNVEGVALYGGVGIVPDIIVGEADHPCWLRSSIYAAIVPYLHQNADWLLDTRLDNFDDKWTVPDSLTEVALSDSRAKDTSEGKLLTAQAAWEVPQFIKWYLAYSIWGDVGTFAVRTRHTAILKRALKVLHEPRMITRALTSVR